ncbi:sensor histidine kinase [Acetonema longum]|uniref:histidine kinase n=1 Tax=Acetonema longum DSM 6540 TaxID=1009370 RepID=F7NM97_9FIRM|nr:sensor histidine kinase [Acetonema longum]EGO62835.1 sensor histidine kinase [Acetonema longum DSM 6540]
MGKNKLALLLMLLLVPLAGELKFCPFDGQFSSFRVSFGSPTFLFFLLWLRNISYIYLGLLTGAAVLLFRIALDLASSDTALAVTFSLRFPAFFYYVAYAAIFQLVRNKQLYNQPLHIGIIAIFAELIASFVELMLTLQYSNAAVLFTVPIVGKIVIIAVIRNFFILSFFFITNLRHAEIIIEQQREKNQHLLLLISGLYEEVVHLAKSLQNAETVTRNCYHVYESLLSSQSAFDKSRLAQNILEIAGQVHDIKKDNQRIFAGLTQLISDGKLRDYMPAQDLADMIVQSHQKYARSLNKEIAFTIKMESGLPQLHVYTVLSLVNNLVSNAVESIKNTGDIKISFSRSGESLSLRVADNGPGIPPKKRNLIFKPGYTTKFDLSGKPSTGMGLPYIKELAAHLHGSIDLETNPHETVFIIQLPLQNLTKEG